MPDDPRPCNATDLDSQTRLELVRHWVSEYHADLFRYAFRLSGNEADAEDLTQQTFLTALDRLHQLRDPQRARSWLFTVLRNAFLKACRRNTPRNASSLDMEIDAIAEPLPAETDFDPERLQQAIDHLDPEFRVVVSMFYFEECSYREIAEQLGLPLGTVMSRLSRAKQHLRTRLVESQVHSAAGNPPRIG
jgi:RNA polymerase sigma-70 factor (ECF subfamily)